MSSRMWRALAAIALVSALIVLSPSWAAAQDAAVDTFMRDQMAARHLPGASVAVIKDGKVVFAKGYGLANVEHQVPATADTVYQLASVTKQITATAVMMLVEEGTLSLDARLQDLLPDMPAAWANVTLTQLLNHSSGIPSYTSVPDFGTMMRKDMTPAELIALVRDRPMDFAPGEKWRYNNTGYILLGTIIEKVTGRPWGEVLQTRIFTPLKMRTARVNDLGAIVPHRAQGYTWSSGSLRNGEYVSPTQPYAAGALLVTLDDLVQWDAALSSGQLVSPASMARMTTPVRLNDGTTHPYGFGIDLTPYHTRPRQGHSGGIPGFSTFLARFVEDKVSVIVLVNEGSGGAERIANGIAERYIPSLREHAPRPIPDTNPEGTAFLKLVVTRIGQGEGERDWFTPEAQAFFFPTRIKEGTERLGSHGALTAFDLMEESTTDKGTVRVYLASYERIGVRCSFTLAPDGKIAGIGLRLE